MALDCASDALLPMTISARRAASLSDRFASAVTIATTLTPARSTPRHDPDFTFQAINASRPVVVTSPL
jgi:hypothetical protein